MTLKEIKMQYAKERSRNGWPLIMLQDTFKSKQMDEVAERYAQSQTRNLIEQNTELAQMLLKCQVLCETLKVNVVAKEIEELLTKYNHLKKM